MNSRVRAYLRGKANTLEAILQIGKLSVTPEAVASLDEALEARELVKVSVLQNCEDEPRDVAEKLAGRVRAEVVQVIGRKIVLYRRARTKETPVVEIPGKLMK